MLWSSAVDPWLLGWEVSGLVAQMANDGEPSHVSANSHTSKDKYADCGLLNSPVLNPEND